MKYSKTKLLMDIAGVLATFSFALVLAGTFMLALMRSVSNTPGSEFWLFITILIILGGITVVSEAVYLLTKQLLKNKEVEVS